MHPRSILTLLLAPLLGASVGCGGGRATEHRPNVLLISLDTVRADRLGCYGYAPARTPNLDALAARGLRFERAYAHTPYTLPSHATLMTGMYPSGHGVHANFQGSIHPEAAPLAQVLEKAGYSTAAFVATSVLDRRFGLARGFGRYDDLNDRPLKASDQVERPGSEVTEVAVKWLEQPRAAPFFAWVHYYDAHDPYAPPEGFRDLADPYDGEIAFVDAQVGALLAALKRLGQLEDTIVVVVADHGEAFGDHGEQGHGLLVYDATMHVPMIFAGPAPIRAGTSREPVGLVDVHPTLLALLGLPAASALEGRSLLPTLRGEVLQSAALQLESEHPLRHFGWAPLYGVLVGPWKYIQAPEEELYDLPADPGETNNLARTRADIRAELAGTLAQMQKRAVRRTAGAVHLGSDARDAIAKLGYTDAGDTGNRTSFAGLKDPKTMTSVAQGDVRARALARNREFAEALSVIGPLIEASPESDELWQVQGTVQLGLGRPSDAVHSFEMSLRSSPKNAERVRLLGDALAAAGRSAEALARYQEALALDPQDGQSHSRLGTWFARNGQLEQALVHFQRFVELEPTSPNAHTNLANALFGSARFDEGIEHLRMALRLDPRCVPAHRALYGVLRQRNLRAPAIEALRAAVAALPRDPFFHMRLAWELATTRAPGLDSPAEAVQLARECLQWSPQDPVLLDLLGMALARQGEYPAAIEAAGAALENARAQSQVDLLGAIEARLELYRRRQPYLE